MGQARGQENTRNPTGRLWKARWANLRRAAESVTRKLKARQLHSSAQPSKTTSQPSLPRKGYAREDTRECNQNRAGQGPQRKRKRKVQIKVGWVWRRSQETSGG